jgi:hypothetical protein
MHTMHQPVPVRKGNIMKASPGNNTFTRTVYRDFALFALAAVGVGMAASLTLATAIVLVAPSPDHAAEGPRIQKTQVAYAVQAANFPSSIRQPAAS